ncbi:helicase HerA-like domain-containing protein [Alterisphingorhabdus coralli]|uniref:Helicase HerA-like domain-containing protein n=1 Tax=Alterisphingorhabdus coralli TaxID=3071408 RepID=A0AA97F7I1_9SPHN|nr:helicase HerA-like domain-containing protein [Parasphingorhabdus sp. SCSIO 66989]WOE75804.1 helicase HerA-like domain-containing protein [Parasphingorhabdus sp. SCSIO 66989]
MSDIFLGLGGDERQALLLEKANRHGLIAGATGTGKTVTLQGLAESFSANGVPVFVADVKGDLSGISMAGSSTFKHADKLEERAKELGMEDYGYSDNPAIFWDLYGEQGHPIRTTISEMGPMLLARLMDLNETQEGVLNIVFRFADEEGLLLLNLEDLQSMLAYTAEHAKELSAKYGNVSRQSVGAIQRQLLQLENEGADQFFGEPALEIDDFMQTDEQGRGYINVLAADKLMRSPKLYATFLLWLLAELFETLPEVGDPEKPTLVFFFDEAHLLFDDAPKALQEKIEQVVRLIRSKGVGVFFVTQNPMDIPEEVAGQLGNRVQHALRAFTKRDQRAIKAAAETFRINPDLDVEAAITELRVGEALVSTLDEEGAPTVVQRTLIKPPRSRLGPVTKKERAIIRSISPVEGKYDEEVDRESAEEVLLKKIEDAAETAAEVEAKGKEEVAKRPRRTTSIWGKAAKAAAGAAAASAGTILAGKLSGRKSRSDPTARAASAAAGTIATEIGKAIGVPGLGRFARNLMGGLMR